MTNTNSNGSKIPRPDIDVLREKLAELEHEQWRAWSQTVAGAEPLSGERIESWTKRWVAYADLSEADKDLDRSYADRVIQLLVKLKLVAEPADSQGQKRE